MPKSSTAKAAVACCAKCGGLSKVMDSRSTIEHVTRRRRCFTCGHRWSTKEVMLDDIRHKHSEGVVLTSLRAIHGHIGALLADADDAEIAAKADVV